MLTFFPIPYPGEWWYSVLCRYHVWSGHSKHQSTIKELFDGKPKAAMGTLFPNSTVWQIVSQLPPQIGDIRTVLLQHTLFPYYIRFYTLEEKEKMLNQLSAGTSVTLTHIWKATTKKVWQPRYCPLCVVEDRKSHGECYWHTAHQIPLASCCEKHGCRLKYAGKENPRLSEFFYPLESVGHSLDADEPPTEYELTLSSILSDYLMLPIHVGPPLNHNNLAQQLFNKGYGIVRKDGNLSLDAVRLYQDIKRCYGYKLVDEVFGNEISATVMNRMVKWNLNLPERYALLQCFARLSTELVFSHERILDIYEQRLHQLRDTGGFYGKKQLAEKLGVKPYQLDKLAVNYGIQPFWEHNDDTSTPKSTLLKIYLTEEERDEIRRKSHEEGFRYESHFVQHCIRAYIAKKGMLR